MKVFENIKVFSVCEDFTDEMYNRLTEQVSPDSYIDYTANSKEELEKQGYSNDEVANHLITLGCEEGEKVLIEIDY